MKKRISVLLMTVFLCIIVFSLSACGGPSIDSIKTKFKDENYEITTFSENSKNGIAGCVDGFYANKGIVAVYIYKFDKKELADEFVRNRESQICKISIKKDVYVCIINVSSYGGSDKDSLEQAAIDIFDGCFK